MIPVQEIRTALGADAPEEPVIQLAIDRATAVLSRELGYYLGLPVEVQQIYPGGTPRIALTDPPFPGEDIVAESYDGNGGWDVIDSADYWQQPGVRSRFLVHTSLWPSTRIRVTYQRGYDPDSDEEGGKPPAELAYVVRGMVLGSLADEGSTASPLKSEKIGDYSYTLADAQAAAGADWDALVDRWRRRRI